MQRQSSLAFIPIHLLYLTSASERSSTKDWMNSGKDFPVQEKPDTGKCDGKKVLKFAN